MPLMLPQGKNMKISGIIEITHDDITEIRADAIVNAANSSLLGGGGVDGAIHRAAGNGLLEECRKLGGCPVGEARITRGYNLPAAHVIHTVGPVYSGKKDDEEMLRSCYTCCLSLAEKNGIKSIAFPAISCGVYGYPINEAAPVAIGTVMDFFKKGCSLTKVYLVLFSEKDASVYRTVLHDMLRNA